MKMAIGGILLLAATAAQADPLKGLISIGDYPREAMDRHEEGTVKAVFRISPQGRATGCQITQSATQALDAATCYVVMRRAKFKPATGEDGTPKESEFSTSVTWKLDYLRENKHNNSTRMQN